MYEKRFVSDFYKLYDVIQEGRQRNLWTERTQRKHQLWRAVGSHFLDVVKGNLWKVVILDLN